MDGTCYEDRKIFVFVTGLVEDEFTVAICAHVEIVRPTKRERIPAPFDLKVQMFAEECNRRGAVAYEIDANQALARIANDRAQGSDLAWCRDEEHFPAVSEMLFDVLVCAAGITVDVLGST